MNDPLCVSIVYATVMVHQFFCILRLILPMKYNEFWSKYVSVSAEKIQMVAMMYIC